MKDVVWKRMSRIGQGILLTLGLCALNISCELKEDEPIDPGPISEVALFHVSPNAPNLDVIVDDVKINNVPFEYDKPTGYLRFSSGVRSIKFTPYGGGTAFIDTDITLEPDEPFSLFVVDDYAQASVLLLFDNLEEPPPGYAKVRFINLSPDSETVQLKIKDDALPLTVGQSFKDASDFMDVEAGLQDFEILSGGNVIYELPDSPIEQGWFYTIFVMGYVTPPTGNTNTLKAEAFINAAGN